MGGELTPEEYRLLAERNKEKARMAFEQLPVSEQNRLLQKEMGMRLQRETNLSRKQRRSIIAEAKRRKKKGIK